VATSLCTSFSSRNFIVFIADQVTLHIDLVTEELKIINEEVKGKVTITINSQINLLNAEEVVVEENVTARLFGTVHKLLVLKKGSTVYFHGQINGEFLNEGGELTIFENDKE
jgi:hypothetical protein